VFNSLLKFAATVAGEAQNDRIDAARSVVITVLDGALRHGTSKAHFAQLVGITPQFISQIIGGSRMPSLKTAMTMAASLSETRCLDAYESERWLHYVDVYWALHQGREIEIAGQAQDSPDHLVAVLRDLHGGATHNANAAESARAYRAAADIGTTAVRWMGSDPSTLHSAESHLILHDVFSVLGRHADALWASNRCTLLCDLADRSALREELPRLEALSMNARRSTVVTLNNLGLWKRAYDLSLSHEAEPAFRHTPEFWKPHVFRDRLSSLARLPRFAISEAEGLADQVLRICDSRGAAQDQLLALMISRTLARALTAANRSDKAKRVLDRWVDGLDKLPYAGPLHKVQFLRAYATCLWKLGDRDGWQTHANQALMLAATAGLTHQHGEISKDIEARTASRP